MAARHVLLAGALVALAAFCAAAPATAGTASVVADPDSATLLYRAAPGERNNLSLSEAAPGTYAIYDQAGVVTGPGCRATPGSGQQVLCTLPLELPARATIQTGDRNDSVSFRTVSLAAKLMGGPGSDSIRGRLTSAPDTNRDGYALRGTEPRLRPSALRSAAQPAAEIHGGPGVDQIYGGAGDDLINPGAGRDWVRASGGDDTILARDGSFDKIECDSGRGQLVVDRLDLALNRCGRIRRRGTALPVPLAAWSGGDGGYVVALAVGCPADGPPTCKGRLTLSVRNGPTLVRRRYRAARGKEFLTAPIVSYDDGQDLESRGAVVRISSTDTAGRMHWISRGFPIEDPFAGKE